MQDKTSQIETAIQAEIADAERQLADLKAILAFIQGLNGPKKIVAPAGKPKSSKLVRHGRKTNPTQDQIYNALSPIMSETVPTKFRDLYIQFQFKGLSFAGPNPERLLSVRLANHPNFKCLGHHKGWVLA
jgi:hypothetical protein